MRRRSLVALLWVAGCVTPAADGGEAEATTEVGGDGDGEPGQIVDNDAWEVLDAVADPLADHRPATVECGIAGWYVENESLEIDTNYCNYLGLHQPSLVALGQGQTVRLGLYYFDLVAPEPAVAHVAILIEGETLWEDEIDIPGPAQVYDVEFESPLAAPAGSEVVFHLHNHGQNTWTFQYLEAG